MVAKRRRVRILAGGVFVFVAGMLFGWRNGSSWGDLPITKRAQLLRCDVPFTDKSGFHRFYSLQMDYDSAVIEIENELAGKGWHEAMYFDYTVFQDPSGKNPVIVERRRLVPLRGYRDFYMDRPPELVGINPDGWVELITNTHPNALIGFLLRHQILSVKNSPVTYYGRVRRAPREGVDDLTKVDVHKGTKDLESDRVEFDSIPLAAQQ